MRYISIHTSAEGRLIVECKIKDALNKYILIDDFPNISNKGYNYNKTTDLVRYKYRHMIEGSDYKFN